MKNLAIEVQANLFSFSIGLLGVSYTSSDFFVCFFVFNVVSRINCLMLKFLKCKVLGINVFMFRPI